MRLIVRFWVGEMGWDGTGAWVCDFWNQDGGLVFGDMGLCKFGMR